MQIETLHHADKQKTEGYILDLLAWLNYLVSRSKATADGGGAAIQSIGSKATANGGGAAIQSIGSKATANGGGAVTQSTGSAVCSPPKEADQPSVAKDASESQL